MVSKLINIFYYLAVRYPAPSNLSYFWNFGVYAMVCMFIQLVTGIFLAMYYTPNVDLAFISVEHIMRDVSNGWLLRYIHANGASMFFIVVYIHIFRGLYYSSYGHPRQLLWLSGVLILLLMIITAFLGYVLPWGQMSFWAATVITNLFSAIPFIGSNIVVWLWGGYAIDNATLVRFFSLHYLLPIILSVLIVIHLFFLHLTGSNNPLGIDSRTDEISFFPYYGLKDLFGLILFIMFFSIFVFFLPNYLGHTDNYIQANPLSTPTHIVPEWYFLLFYAILRSIPNKLAGVLALVMAIIVLGLIPFLSKPLTRSVLTSTYFFRYLFWIFVSVTVLLGWIGQESVKYPFVGIGQFLTILYFGYFICAIPVVNLLDKYFWRDLN